MDLDETLLYRIIGERLKQRRFESGVTQAQLAEATGVMRTSITNIEAGRQKPPLHLLYKLCMALDMEVSSFVPVNEEVVGSSAVPFNIYSGNDELPPQLAEILRGVGE